MPRKKGHPGDDPLRSSNDATLPPYLDPDGSHGKLQVMLMKPSEEGGKPLPTNPFTLAKSIQSVCGTVSEAYRDKDGNFVLKVRGEEKVKKLKRMTELIDKTQVVVVEHPRLNKCKVVVTCRSVDGLSDEDLKGEETLQEQGVIDVKRFKKDGKPGPTMVLTIRGTVAPKAIYFGYERCETKPYAQAPLQCYKCFDYGHPKDRCQGQEICRNCSGNHKIEKDENGRTICLKPARCLHCGGKHSPTSRFCEKYKEEEEIEKIRGSGKSPRQARLIFEEMKRRESNSYATAVTLGSQSSVQDRLTAAQQSDNESLKKELASTQAALKRALENRTVAAQQPENESLKKELASTQAALKRALEELKKLKTTKQNVNPVPREPEKKPDGNDMEIEEADEDDDGESSQTVSKRKLSVSSNDSSESTLVGFEENGDAVETTTDAEETTTQAENLPNKDPPNPANLSKPSNKEPEKEPAIPGNKKNSKNPTKKNKQ